MGLAAVVLLVLANGFFVYAEFALVAVERARIERAAQENDKRAVRARGALTTLSFQLSGAQLGITVTSLIVGFLAEPAIARPLEPLIEGLPFIPRESALAVSIGLALALSTAVQMVFGELLPKNLAIARPFESALALAGPLRAFNAAFRPLIVFLNAAANFTVRLLGIEPREELAAVRTLEEFALLVRASRDEGALAEEEASLIARSITFGDKTAADALVPRTSIVAIQDSAKLTDLAQVALETGHSRFPVYGNDLDDILGMVHIKDIYRYPIEERGDVPVSEIVQEALVVPESRALDDLLVDMRAARKQMAIVIDEYGGTAGIITLEDLLEEIVGEIEDEYDSHIAESPLTSPARGVYVVSGMLHPDEVREQTGFQMPEGDYETLAGFLLWLFDRIPEPGDHASFKGWEFKVIEMDGRRITKVLLVAPPDTVEELPK